MTPEKAPRPAAKSLQILRRRVREEMRKPGREGHPRFTSDVQLARFVGITDSHMSLFLRKETRGVSWRVVDKLATALELEIWQLFYLDAPYTWKSK